jgi:hypothetical protein
MEDALISPMGFMILSGAGLIEGTEDSPIKVHATETVKVGTDGVIYLKDKPVVESDQHTIYVMKMKDGEIDTEPYIYDYTSEGKITVKDNTGKISEKDVAEIGDEVLGYKITIIEKNSEGKDYDADTNAPKAGDTVFVDYYVKRGTGSMQIDITPNQFGGNFYLEASTLFREPNGVDMPAEFIIPNCKIQSNFTFTMASSGDPSTFTFTMDAFPDYTRFDTTKKVLASIQVIADDKADGTDDVRKATHAGYVPTTSSN